MQGPRDHVDHGEDVCRFLPSRVPTVGRCLFTPRGAVSVSTLGKRASSWLKSTDSPASALAFNSANSPSALGLFDRIAPQQAVGRPIRPDLVLAAEPLHGRAAGGDAVGLPPVVGQLGMGPVGPIEPLGRRPVDDPAADDRDRQRLALGLARPQGGDAALEVGIEPVLDGAGADAEVGGDVLGEPTPVGEPDDLESVPELSISSLKGGLLKALGVSVGQDDADHGDTRRDKKLGWTPHSTDRKASAGL